MVETSEPTKDEIQQATLALADIMSKSSVLRTGWLAMVASHQLCSLLQAYTRVELEDGWECANPSLILQVLLFGTRQEAKKEFTVVELQHTVRNIVLPYLDILVKAEADNVKESNDTSESEVLPGCDDGPTTGLADTLL